MKVVGLISGGKDSCYNMMLCVAAGHEVVGLANLMPQDIDELDSYMYQSVGHMGIDLYSEALQLPLYRRVIEGKSIRTESLSYEPTAGDEVEDLYLLLKDIKNKVEYDALSVGAVLSDYQRIRVENVCKRLGLVCLAYMWRRDQSELLAEMITCGISAIVIKVASYGLKPRQHLGMPIDVLHPQLEEMKEKCHLNLCGEGGEYETFTLDCPLFRKRIVVNDFEIVEFPGDVGYLNFKSLELKPKTIPTGLSQKDMMRRAGVRTPLDYVREAIPEFTTDDADTCVEPSLPRLKAQDSKVELDLGLICPTAASSPAQYTWSPSLFGDTFEDVVEQLKECLSQGDLILNDIISIKLFTRCMSEFMQINQKYQEYFDYNPPVRMCVETPLEGSSIQLEFLAWRAPEHQTKDDGHSDSSKHCMHVTSISNWAPANIGPYSQAIKIGPVVQLAGVIGLVPGLMKMCTNSAELQSKMVMCHLSRIVEAVMPKCGITSIVQGVCFITRLENVKIAKKIMDEASSFQISTYVVVSALPKRALVEWHTWAHAENTTFKYDEHSKVIGCLRVTSRRRFSCNGSVLALVSSTKKSPDVEVNESDVKLCLSDAFSMVNTKETFHVTIYYGDHFTRSEVARLVHDIKGEYKFMLSLVPVLALEDESVILSLHAVQF